jgi:hypothetical protein
MRCDFCSEPDPVWSYPAKDILVIHPGPADQRSAGAWAACGLCYRLIESGDATGLANRSLEHFPDLQELTQQEGLDLLDMLRSIHLAFWEARNGPPEKIFM